MKGKEMDMFEAEINSAMETAAKSGVGKFKIIPPSEWQKEIWFDGLMAKLDSCTVIHHRGSELLVTKVFIDLDTNEISGTFHKVASST